MWAGHVTQLLDCWISIQKVQFPGQHKTGHDNTCLYSQHLGDGGRGSGVQSHPQLHKEFETRLRYLRSSKNNKNKIKWYGDRLKKL